MSAQHDDHLKGRYPSTSPLNSARKDMASCLWTAASFHLLALPSCSFTTDAICIISVIKAQSNFEGKSMDQISIYKQERKSLRAQDAKWLTLCDHRIGLANANRDSGFTDISSSMSTTSLGQGIFRLGSKRPVPGKIRMTIVTRDKVRKGAQRFFGLPGESFRPPYRSFARGLDAQWLTATRLVGWNPTTLPSPDITTWKNMGNVIVDNKKELKNLHRYD